MKKKVDNGFHLCIIKEIIFHLQSIRGEVSLDVMEKLAVLADAAKYDVACTSSGSNRAATRGTLGKRRSMWYLP